jgi:hypothetical protein
MSFTYTNSGIINRHVPKVKRMSMKESMGDSRLSLARIARKIAKLVQKNPHKVNIIQTGDFWQFPFSNNKGPTLNAVPGAAELSKRKFGAQFTPIPDTKSEKCAVNGSETSK